MKVRKDFSVIADFVKTGQRVLDLGCATGDLLAYLRSQKKAIIYGIEKEEKFFEKALAKGIPVVQGNVEKTLEIYPDHFFDLIVLSRTVQELRNPGKIIEQMLTKGKYGVVSFLNYGYYKNRLLFLTNGRKPVTEAFLGEWPNQREIKPLSLRDFESFAKRANIKIVQKVFLSGDWRRKTNFFPNLFCGVAIYFVTAGSRKKENIKDLQDDSDLLPERNLKT